MYAKLCKVQIHNFVSLFLEVLSECLDVVSLVCKGMGYSTQSIFPVVKKLYSQFSGSARLTTSFLNFFILCGKTLQHTTPFYMVTTLYVGAPFYMVTIHCMLVLLFIW